MPKKCLSLYMHIMNVYTNIHKIYISIYICIYLYIYCPNLCSSITTMNTHIHTNGHFIVNFLFFFIWWTSDIVNVNFTYSMTWHWRSLLQEFREKFRSNPLLISHCFAWFNTKTKKHPKHDENSKFVGCGSKPMTSTALFTHSLCRFDSTLHYTFIEFCSRLWISATSWHEYVFVSFL